MVWSVTVIDIVFWAVSLIADEPIKRSNLACFTGWKNSETETSEELGSLLMANELGYVF